MTSLTLDALVQRTGKLLAIPRVVGEVLRLLDSPNCRQADVAATLSQDPALVAIVLRLANSPAFAQVRTVDSIERAIILLGFEQVRRLVIAGAVTQASDRLPKQNLLPLEPFWRHSSYCAVIARLIAEIEKPSLAGTVFLGGLLHDLGQLVLFSQLPGEAHHAFLRSLAEPTMISPQEAERMELGFDHAMLGGELADRWGLPEVLSACLRYHHSPLDAPPDLRAPVAFVCIANTCAHLAEVDSRDWRDAPPLDPEVLKLVTTSPDDLLGLIESAQHQVLAVESMRHPD